MVKVQATATSRRSAAEGMPERSCRWLTGVACRDSETVCRKYSVPDPVSLRLYHISRKLYIFFVTSHNFFSLSSVQIIIIPACCLLCVL